jgi:lipopolysaccharide export system ATP-binding protein
MTLFSAKQLIKIYGKKAVVNGLSFYIDPGEVVGLLGPNGAGKTTAFYTVVGLIALDGGTLTFKKKPMTHLPMHKRAQMGLGYLAQEPSIFRGLTVEENLMCILQLMPLTHKERKNRLETLLSELNLKTLRKAKAVTLSGGERRRVEITRSLITSPSLLLLDEPFANIDPISVEEVKRLIRHLKEKGISILITDHNAREIFSIVDRAYIVFEGREIASGKKEELVQNPIAKKIYFGEDFTL